MLRQAETEDECRALAMKYDRQVNKLKEVNPARWHHIVNLAMLRRADFRRERDRRNQAQAEMF